MAVTLQKTIVRRRVLSTNASWRPYNGASNVSNDHFGTVAPPLLRVLVLYMLFLFLLYVMLQMASVLFTSQINPILESSKWPLTREANESTYPELFCDASALTSSELDPLVVHSCEQGVDTMLHHGAGYFPDLLKRTTTKDLRDFVLWRNQNISPTENIPVIGYAHRWSFGINVQEHESISTALQELQSNKILKEVLEQLVGYDPALVELSTITTGPGAAAQYFHQDTPSSYSATRYARSVVPMYSLLIPLQDTYPEMGPTAVCPGSHKCSHMPSCNQDGFELYNKSSGYWSAGDGLLYNSEVQHRGSAHAHVDVTSRAAAVAGGNYRVALIMTWTSRPDYLTTPSHFSRSLPLGAVWALRWNMWGFTWSTLDQMANPPTIPTSLGGWSFVRALPHRVMNNAFGYRLMDLQALLKYTSFRRIPWFLQGRIIDNGRPFVTYFEDILENARKLTLALNGGVILVLILTRMYYHKDNGSREMAQRTLSPCFVVLALFYMSILFLCGFIGVSIQSSEWGQGIRHIAKHPIMPQGSMSPRSVGVVPIPPRLDDMLLSSRLLHAPKLAPAQRRVFAFHPGNQRWRKAVEERAEVFVYNYSGLPSMFRERLIHDCIEQTRNYKFFFLQEIESGDWIQMSNIDVMKYTNGMMVTAFLGRESLFVSCERLRLCSSNHAIFDRLFSVDFKQPQHAIEPKSFHATFRPSSMVGAFQPLTYVHGLNHHSSHHHHHYHRNIRMKGCG